MQIFRRCAFSRPRSILVFFCVIATAVMISARSAQAYPERTIQLIVNYAAGGATDIFARLLAEELSKRFGQAVVVKNVVGGGGGIGALEAIRSTPDGYTLMFSTNILAVESGLKKAPRFDVAKDLVPITQVAATNIVLLARADLPFGNLKEFAAYVKANPGKLNFGSSGFGSTGHILGAYLSTLTGGGLVHVPFTGNAPALNAMMGGQIELLWNDVGAAVPYVESGKVKMIALSSKRGSAVAPTISTLAQEGYPEFDLDFQLGVFAPAGTPPDIVKKLNAEIVAALRASKIESTLKSRGYALIGNTPEEYTVQMRDEVKKWAIAIERAGIERQ